MSEIAEFYESVGSDLAEKGTRLSPEVACNTPASTVGSNKSVQWAAQENGRFQPCGATVPVLPAAIFKGERDDYGRFRLARIDARTDNLLRLPDSAGDQVILAIQRFWQERQALTSRGYLFKRGILLWGPPGSGKTSTIQILAADLIARGGIVYHANDPQLAEAGLEAIRTVEPERPMIVLLEDVDELCLQYGEARWLALLDGETQVDNVVFIASTNYPERLDKRFINRPGRFDEIIKVGMPNEAARRLYLSAKLQEPEREQHSLDTMVSDTDGLSIAHLRELVYAVFCDHRSYNETLKRLRGMARTPNSQSAGDIGFGVAGGGK